MAWVAVGWSVLRLKAGFGALLVWVFRRMSWCALCFSRTKSSSSSFSIILGVCVLWLVSIMVSFLFEVDFLRALLWIWCLFLIFWWEMSVEVFYQFPSVLGLYLSFVVIFLRVWLSSARCYLLDAPVLVCV